MAKTDRQTDRASSWSITINNPKEEEYKVPLPAGWVLEGQIERGEEGTEHFQGYLKTNQVRFSAVKKVFPRAHIEVARNVKALQNYVHKESTRVAAVPTQTSSQVSMFNYMHVLAAAWDTQEFDDYCQTSLETTHKGDMGEARLGYMDMLIARHISDALYDGIEYIGVNPMFRNAWKRYGHAIVQRELAIRARDESAAFVSEDILEIDNETDRQEKIEDEKKDE